jgi:hypothetical protein
MWALRSRSKSKHDYDNCCYLSGYTQIDLPPTFDLYADFTLSGWVLIGYIHENAFAMSIECANFHRCVLKVGDWAHHGEPQKFLAVEYCAPDRGNEPFTWIDAKEKYECERWYHTAVVKQQDRLGFYVDGVLQGAQDVVHHRTPLEKVSA